MSSEVVSPSSSRQTHDREGATRVCVNAGPARSLLQAELEASGRQPLTKSPAPQRGSWGKRHSPCFAGGRNGGPEASPQQPRLARCRRADPACCLFVTVRSSALINTFCSSLSRKGCFIIEKSFEVLDCPTLVLAFVDPYTPSFLHDFIVFHVHYSTKLRPGCRKRGYGQEQEAAPLGYIEDQVLWVGFHVRQITKH